MLTHKKVPSRDCYCPECYKYWLKKDKVDYMLTVLQWYKPSNKLPKLQSMTLISTEKDYILTAEFKKDSEGLYFATIDYTYEPEEVLYWTEFPQIG
jgi:hypothetical protein